MQHKKTKMKTPDEIAREIVTAAQSGDGDKNVMDYAIVKLNIWREQIRQDEITRCATLWALHPKNEKCQP